MANFWPACPYENADRKSNGSVRISDEFLRALWRRAEVAPEETSCRNERALHEKLLARPRQLLNERQLATIADGDTRANYALLQSFIARLLAASSADDAYRAIFSGGNVGVAPLFIDLISELMLRDLLRDCSNAFEVRAAELLFRNQKVSIQNGAVMLADMQAIERHASGKSFGAIGQLLVDARIKPRNVDLDVLGQANAHQYWERSGDHDMVLPFQSGGAGLEAFCRVLEKWILRLLGLRTEIHPLPAIEEQRWAWHIGLDAEASTIMNELYRGQALNDERRSRLLALFEMRICDPVELRPEVAGRRIYLACAMTEEHVLRIKPQNFLLNMPIVGKSSR
ncbi:DUF6352 family protein [Lacisediminimonas sp.]|uniref:DUF6352 family protein n=1 Tax=Lacisediminimonas sp. TaxID=3060582 RepID=UPI002721E25B|nr:DUF6352 family protein [Lacisediminimonas sp.]MDO8300921.1 DUF6352 family protein [Lacisediminimonas sp.]